MILRNLKLAETLALPANEAVTQKYGFIGRSGSGKSYGAMKLAELFLESGAQIINYSVTSRHVDNSLSYLRTLELIDGTRDALTASEELFS